MLYAVGGGVPMGDDDDEIQSDDKIQSLVTKDRANHFEMDEAFCARMCEAIAAGQENVTIGIVTTPGTNNPKLAGRYGALLPQFPTTLDD
jgi:hypothetical protein